MTNYIEVRKTLWAQYEMELLNAQELDEARERYKKLIEIVTKEAENCRLRAEAFRKGAEAVGKLENENS